MATAWDEAGAQRAVRVQPRDVEEGVEGDSRAQVPDGVVEPPAAFPLRPGGGGWWATLALKKFQKKHKLCCPSAFK